MESLREAKPPSKKSPLPLFRGRGIKGNRVVQSSTRRQSTHIIPVKKSLTKPVPLPKTLPPPFKPVYNIRGI
jgi:hypothetical protein